MLFFKIEFAEFPGSMEAAAFCRIKCCIPVVRSITGFSPFDTVEVHTPYIPIFWGDNRRFPEILEWNSHFDGPVLVIGTSVLTVTIDINVTLYILEIPFEPSLDFPVQTFTCIYYEQIDFCIDGIDFVLVVVMSVTIWVDRKFNHFFTPEWIILFGESCPGVGVFAIESNISSSKFGPY